MKKTISTILVCILLVGSLLTLASCEVAGFVFGTYSRTDNALVAEITTTYEFSLTEVTKTVVTKIGNTTTTSDPEVMKYKVGKNDEGEKVIFITVTNGDKTTEKPYSFNSGKDDGGFFIEIDGIRYDLVK